MTGRGLAVSVELSGALEIGGSHVSSALVDGRTGQLIPGSRRRRHINPGASADELVNGFASAMTEVDAAPDTPWGIAIPGPFDYPRGIGLFKGVGKFDALLDVDLTARLHAALPALAGGITFVNDADAFAVGEWCQGVTAAAARCVGITLGSGIGSSFLDNGTPVHTGPTVPPHGRAHRLKIGDADLEDVVSRRAILARYLAKPGVSRAPGLDVHDVCDRSRGGDGWATRVIEDAFHALGGALASWFTRFDATAVAFGGGMTGSWDLVLPPLRRGLTAAGASADIALLPSTDTEGSALVGAAIHAHPMHLLRRTSAS
ncbi:MAG: ROK family protein [Nakamurella sp.]